MKKSIAIEKVSNHIPDDLVFSVLSKLPLKSVKRFSCVHKSWSLLFEDPNFMNIYLNTFISSTYDEEDGSCSCLLLQHSFQSVLYLLSGERFENKVKLDWPPPFQEDGTGLIHIVGPVINGIVCLNEGRSNVVLWNPASEEFKVLPPSPTESPVLYEDNDYFVHGFGYDHVRDDYKVIRFVYYRLDVPNDVLVDMEDKPIGPSRDNVWEIYNLRSNTWTKLDLDMPIDQLSFVGVHVYLKGVCHWYQEYDNNSYMVSFDLSNETFCTTPLPPLPSDMNDRANYVCVMRHLMVLNDSIALISNYQETPTFHISILGELGVKESWTKLFILGPLPCIEHPIGEGNNSDLFFRRKDDELVRFNLSTQMMEELGIKGHLYGCHILNYKESFLAIGRLNY